MPASFYVGLFLLIVGSSLTILTYFKYTSEVHEKEVDENRKNKGDYIDWTSWSNILFSLFINMFIKVVWISKKSYIVAKSVLMLSCLVITGFGGFLIWATLTGH